MKCLELMDELCISIFADEMNEKMMWIIFIQIEEFFSRY